MEYVGIDLHKKESQVCLLTETGEVIERRIRTEPQRFAEMLGGRPRARIVVEAYQLTLRSLGCELELAQPAKVDAHHPAHLDQHHHDGVAGAAADDDARAAEIDLALGHWAVGPAAAALRLRHRHSTAKDVVQHSADHVAVEGLHQRPPVAPNRSVLMHLGA